MYISSDDALYQISLGCDELFWRIILDKNFLLKNIFVENLKSSKKKIHVPTCVKNMDIAYSCWCVVSNLIQLRWKVLKRFSIHTRISYGKIQGTITLLQITKQLGFMTCTSPFSVDALYQISLHCDE